MGEGIWRSLREIRMDLAARLQEIMDRVDLLSDEAARMLQRVRL